MTHELERARKALRELGKSLKSLPGNLPPREVHKLRTTARRVEAMAAVLVPGDEKKSRRLLKSIEPVRKAAGGVRDMDVMLAHAHSLARRSSGDSLTRLIEHIQIARRRQANLLDRALGRRRNAARKDLKEYSRLVRAALASAIDESTGGESSAHPPENLHAATMDAVRELNSWPSLGAENIHEFRLKVKELRYLLEISADSDPALVGALTAAQRRIGDWHDWHQLEEIAREVLVREEDAALLTRIGQSVLRRLGRALAEANSLRGKYLAAPPPFGI